MNHDLYTKGNIVAHHLTKAAATNQFYLLTQENDYLVWYKVMPEMGLSSPASWVEVVRLDRIVSEVDFAMIDIEEGNYFTAI